MSCCLPSRDTLHLPVAELEGFGDVPDFDDIDEEGDLECEMLEIEMDEEDEEGPSGSSSPGGAAAGVSPQLSTFRGIAEDATEASSSIRVILSVFVRFTFCLLCVGENAKAPCQDSNSPGGIFFETICKRSDGDVRASYRVYDGTG